MTDTLFQTLDLLGGDSSTWDLYRETFNTTGPKSLFMIPFVSDITPEDVEKSARLVEFYLGSSDNITLDNAQALIDMFTDSGKILIIESLENSQSASSLSVQSFENDVVDRCLLWTLSPDQ